MKRIAVIFAAGKGTRMNSLSLPKPFLLVNGFPIIVYTLRWFQEHEQIDEIMLVCAAEWTEYARAIVKKYDLNKVSITVGGASAIESQYKGLQAVRMKHEEAIVLMHDGVRPLINPELIGSCIESVKQFGSAITVANASETVLCVDDEQNVCSIFNRDSCKIGRAPQCFYLSTLLELHEKYRAELPKEVVDSASLASHYGMKLHTVCGPAENIKLTTPSDYYYFKAMIDARENQQFAEI